MAVVEMEVEERLSADYLMLCLLSEFVCCVS